MKETNLGLQASDPSGLRILLTDTNRWPAAARMAIAFRGHGCKVAALCPTPGHPVQKVNGVARVFRYNGLEPIESLSSAIESFDPDIIVPCCDRGLQHLHQLHGICKAQGAAGDRTAALIELSLGSPDSFPIVSSRYELLKLAQSEDILIPRMIDINVGSELQHGEVQSSSSWVLKADGTWGGQGVRIANSAEEVRHHFLELGQHAGLLSLGKRLLLNRDRDWVLSEWRRSRRSVIAQSLIKGRPANCAVVCWKGKVLAGIAVEVLKARGETGPSTVVKVVAGREMMNAAEAIAGRLGISGFFGLDFMIERETGSVYLIEMNPRTTPVCPLPVGKGHNLVAAFLASLTGQPEPANLPSIGQDVIGFFPRCMGLDEVTDRSEAASIYCDIPEGEPELVKCLLHPRSSRSVAGRLFDLIRRKHPESAFVSFEDLQPNLVAMERVEVDTAS